MTTDKPVFVMPDLKGPCGNAYWLLGEAQRVMKAAGYSETARTSFHDEATSGDYDHLLATILNWFVVVAPKTEYVPINSFEELNE